RAARQRRVRLRPALPERRPRQDLRRGDPGGEGRREPPRPRLRRASRRPRSSRRRSAVTDLVPQNRLRVRLAEGATVVGTMLVEIRQPAIMTLLASAGFDFVLIDTEHGPFSIESVAELSRAARDAGVTPIVRVPELAYAYVAQALDGGAQGIMLPRVTTRAEVEECVGYMKYAPEGRRGAVLARGHTGFRGGPLADVLAAMNRETFLIVQVETAEAVQRLDDILAVPGVDA